MVTAGFSIRGLHYVEGTKGSPGGSLSPVCEHLQPYPESLGRVSVASCDPAHELRWENCPIVLVTGGQYATARSCVTSVGLSVLSVNS